MNTNISALDLAALLCSRVCHDAVGPVGAIANGLEILEEETDPEMRKMAEDLVRKSVKQASAKLTYARMAFGAAGGGSSEMSLGEAKQIARQFLAEEKIALSWEAADVMLPKNRIKLLLNLILIALTAIPRGGNLTVRSEGENSFRLICEGEKARIPMQSTLFAAPPASLEGVDAHSIQPVYTALLAEACAMKVSFDKTQEAIHILVS